MIGGNLMANVNDIKSKAVKITLADGVERNIKYTLNAMAELEDKYGSVDEAFAQLDKNSIKAVRCVLWAGLIHEDPELTEQQVGNLIDIQCMQNLMKTLNTALDSDMPAPESTDNKLDGTQDPNL